jgi:hypothetical protein
MIKFDYTQHTDKHIGFIEFGQHSISEIEVYLINGSMYFMDHDEPEVAMTYAECREFFYKHDAGPEWEEQITPLNEQVK